AFLALDGDPRVVRDFLPAAGKTVEEGGLPAIGDADQGEAEHLRRLGGGIHGRRAGGASSTQTVSTSRRRRARVVSAILTTNGSPPGRAWASTSMRSPLTKPSSTRRLSRGDAQSRR